MQLLLQRRSFLSLLASLSVLLLPTTSATPLPAPISNPTNPGLIIPNLYTTDICTPNTSSIPHLWSVQIQNITYSIPSSDSQFGSIPGTATFSITNTLTNSTNNITCSMRFDSLCEIKIQPAVTATGSGNKESEEGVLGVLGEEGVLDIHLQVLIEVAYVTVVQNVTCAAGGGGGGGEGGKGEGSVVKSVGGMAEVWLGCDYEVTPKRCWGDGEGWVDAEVLGEVPGGGTGG
ncbi:hypothetical protein B0T20DRAFT_244986 [Sordaria brevicollis]|uniref:Ubiquitin 3 binding protein But2 C-terminal domain-containing protein n=1 Tax=Sordaria brevicollis TaxID=83679 RepID=A0AAE0PC66_SORBR|nr:hypothetical protein B0T20DRAFT_244986 [Sordaria brevicollis]